LGVFVSLIISNQNFMKEQQSDKLHNLRHSLAHILASAVVEMFPKAQLGVGPVIENGFFYDFLLPRPLTPEDIKKIEKRMRELVKQKLSFDRQDMSFHEAKAHFDHEHQLFKIELIKDIEKFGTTVFDEIANQESGIKNQESGIKVDTVSLYKTGKFTDLCRGGHVKNTSEVDPQSFKLNKISGAYWRGDQKNPQMQRIYGLSFETKKELEEYLHLLEEAEKRDHKKLGKELGLYAFSPLVGPGLPLLLPKGELIFHELEKFMREEKQNRGYRFVHIPHIAKTELYKKSGHLGKYDAMMPIMIDAEGGEYVLKAMNCPHHFEVYNAEPHSYRDLPYRIAETTTVYRNEKSGELSGLVRVKALTQDDTHHVIRHDQIQDEIEMILGLMDKVYNSFGFKDYTVQISTRDLKHPEKYFGDDKLWDKSEKILINAVKKWGRPYVIKSGEAAFYGPKIDIMVKDSIGRDWQLTTVQLDFNQPENFHMRYTGEDGQDQSPAVLHVAILGSIERFMGVLIEHFAGAFPTWLAPVQAMILPISDKQNKYAEKVLAELKENGIRVELDDRNESIGKKIRDAEMQKIPYMLIIGEKEMTAKSVAIRARNQQDLGAMKLEKFVGKITEEIKTRA
jgi:threonyl-tRNA synthetase